LGGFCGFESRCHSPYARDMGSDPTVAASPGSPGLTRTPGFKRITNKVYDKAQQGSTRTTHGDTRKFR